MAPGKGQLEVTIAIFASHFHVSWTESHCAGWESFTSSSEGARPEASQRKGQNIALHKGLDSQNFKMDSFTNNIAEDFSHL